MSVTLKRLSEAVDVRRSTQRCTHGRDHVYEYSSGDYDGLASYCPHTGVFHAGWLGHKRGGDATGGHHVLSILKQMKHHADKHGASSVEYDLDEPRFEPIAKKIFKL